MLSWMPPLSFKSSIQSCNYGSAGKIREPPSTTHFLQQKRRSRKRKTGVWSAVLGFSSHFRNRRAEVCGKFRNPRARRRFRAKKPQVEALLPFGVVDKFGICRILPNNRLQRLKYLSFAVQRALSKPCILHQYSYT